MKISEGCKKFSMIADDSFIQYQFSFFFIIFVDTQARI